MYHCANSSSTWPIQIMFQFLLMLLLLDKLVNKCQVKYASKYIFIVIGRHIINSENKETRNQFMITSSVLLIRHLHCNCGSTLKIFIYTHTHPPHVDYIINQIISAINQYCMNCEPHMLIVLVKAIVLLPTYMS